MSNIGFGTSKTGFDLFLKLYVTGTAQCFDARMKGKFLLHQRIIHFRAILSYPGMGLHYSKSHQFVNTYLYIW